MQWLIDIIKAWLYLYLKGMIVLWSGAIVDIPDGWQLCDGTNGTPNLRDRFIVGAGTGYAVGATGGSVNHNHDFTGDGHTHNIPVGIGLLDGFVRSSQTGSEAATGTTDNADGRPPYYALAYIMKL